jgi:hypothetical protein
MNLVSVGQARHADAFTAARSAARQARERLIPNQEPAWSLVFVGGLHDATAALAGLRAELGALPIVGGSSVGSISSQGAHASGYECALMLFSKAFAPTAIITAGGLETDEIETGRQLGRQLDAMALTPERVVLLFYDSVKSAPPPVLHVGSRLLDGLHDALGQAPPLIVGAGTLSDLDLSSSYLFDGRGLSHHSAVAIVLPPSLAGHTTIMHGCLPASDFLEITRVDGARVLDIQGQPALQVVEDRLRISRDQLLARYPLPNITLGQKYGDPYAAFNDDQYVNRLVIAVDPHAEALMLFEADFAAGSRIQIMSYDPQRMTESARIQTDALLAKLGGQQLAFGLYFDCAGRSMPYVGLDEDESTPVRERIGALCPLLGFYSGVEIAPFRGRARPLDWTGVLLICTIRDSS